MIYYYNAMSSPLQTKRMSVFRDFLRSLYRYEPIDIDRLTLQFQPIETAFVKWSMGTDRKNMPKCEFILSKLDDTYPPPLLSHGVKGKYDTMWHEMMSHCDTCNAPNATKHEYDIDEIAMTVTNYYCDACSKAHLHTSLTVMCILITVSAFTLYMWHITQNTL
jgi:hypothetical protein